MIDHRSSTVFFSSIVEKDEFNYRRDESFKKLLSTFRPSSEMLLRTGGGRGRERLGGGFDWKHTITMERLSVLCLRSASSTSSLQQAIGSLCSWSFRRAMSTAFWLRKTSQIPSQPMIRNSSSSVSFTLFSSGSAIRGPLPFASFNPSMCQSPIALVTFRCPFRYPPSSMNPPEAFIRFNSLQQSGLWSLDISIAAPFRLRTARQSPVFATTNDLQHKCRLSDNKASKDWLIHTNNWLWGNH